MQNYRRFLEITRNYPELQGLRMVPFGLFLILIGLQSMGLPYLGTQGDCTVTLPLLIAMLVLWFVVGRYYERTFGKVELLGKRTKQLRMEAVLLVGFIVVIILENILYRSGIRLPISFIEISIGVALLWVGVKTKRWYYDIAGALTLVMSNLPWITGAGVGDIWFGSMGIGFDLAFGVIFCLIGLLDHFRLVHSLSGLNGDAHAGVE